MTLGASPARVPVGPRQHLVAVVLATAFIGQTANVAVAAGALAKTAICVETGLGRYEFEVEVAETPAQQAQGLMFRRSLAPDAGMLFNYVVERPVSMWMKNTYIPLDMLFIEGDGRIANMAERTIPFSLTPISSAGPVRAVLEVNAGTVARLGIEPGDRIHHAIFGTEVRDCTSDTGARESRASDSAA